MDATPKSSSALPLEKTVKTSRETIYNLFSPGSIDLVDTNDRDMVAYPTPPDRPFLTSPYLIATPIDPLEAVSDDDSYDAEGRLIADSDPEECGCLQGKYSGKKRHAKMSSPKKVKYAKTRSITFTIFL
jgi:hypothetical protein